MWNALQAVNIPKMLICQWGTPYINPSGNLEGPAQWTRPISTSYRLSDDILPSWENVMRIVNEAIHINLKGLSGPGHYGDMDLLEVGNPGMTPAEQQSHFSLWAAFKSALMISTNVPAMSAQTHSILANKAIIAINQDPLGTPAKLHQRLTNDHDIYTGPLARDDQVVLLLDTSNTTRALSINLAALGIASADLADLWAGTTQRAATAYTATVPPHGCIVLRLSNIRRTAPPSSNPVPYAFHPAAAATVSNGARLRPAPGCHAGGLAATSLSANDSSALTFTRIRTSRPTSAVRVSYINAAIGYTFAPNQGPNVRGAMLSVNGGVGVHVLFPVTGYDWASDVLDAFLVELAGFDVHAENEVSVRGWAAERDGEFPLSGWAPEFCGVAVVE